MHILYMVGMLHIPFGIVRLARLGGMVWVGRQAIIDTCYTSNLLHGAWVHLLNALDRGVHASRVLRGIAPCAAVDVDNPRRIIGVGLGNWAREPEV